MYMVRRLCTVASIQGSYAHSKLFSTLRDWKTDLAFSNGWVVGLQDHKAKLRDLIWPDLNSKNIGVNLRTIRLRDNRCT